MSVKTEIITAKIETDLKNAFMAIAESKHRPASQVLRDLIRVYVESNKVPNDKTLQTLQKTDNGEDVHHARNAADLFKQLDI